MTRREEKLVSRRQFVRLGAGGVAAAVVAGCYPAEREPSPKPRPSTKAKVAPTPKPEPPPKPAPPPPPYGRYEMGVQSYCFHDRKFKFEDAIAEAAKLGLHYIEPFPGHFRPDSKPERVAAVNALLKAKQVTMNAYGVCGFSNNEAQARKILSFCKAQGIGVITASPRPDSLKLLDKLVEEYDIKIAIHNHGPGDKTWGRTAQMVNGIKNHHANIGVCLDTGHLARTGDCSIECARKLGPRLHSLHIKDWKDAKPVARRQDCIIGQGIFDLEAFFTVLKEIDFDGPISVEWERDFKNPVPGIAGGLEALRKVIAKVG